MANIRFIDRNLEHVVLGLGHENALYCGYRGAYRFLHRAGKGGFSSFPKNAKRLTAVLSCLLRGWQGLRKRSPQNGNCRIFHLGPSVVAAMMRRMTRIITSVARPSQAPAPAASMKAML